MASTNSGHHQGKGEVIEELAKLKGLSEDDKTEMAMLRSRIDEQCELIMILKQRADDLMQQLKTTERMKKELEEFREHAQGAINIESTKFTMMEARFNDLADNHQELIKYKDMYKLENEKLRKENAQLIEDNKNLFSAALVEKQKMIDELEEQLTRLKDRNVNLEERARESHESMMNNRSVLQERLRKSESTMSERIHELEKRLKEMEASVKDSNHHRQMAQTRNENENIENRQVIQKLTKEKEDLLELVMQRGRIIEEKVTENKNLEVQAAEARRRQKNAEDRFEQEAAAVDANIQVVKLRKELVQAQDHMLDVDKKFEAYKSHTNKLLQQERDLNAKLRHLAG